MKSIYVDPMNEYFWSDGKAVYSKDKTKIIYCASNIGDSYIILPTVTMINEGCFVNSQLKSITIPKTVTEILSYAFSYSKISTIELPPNITTIYYECFSGSSLTSVSIPNKVTSIQEGAFSGCNLLTYLYIPESVTTLGGGCLPSSKTIVINVSEKSTINIDKQHLVLSKDNTSLIQCLSEEPNIIIPHKVKNILSNAFSSSKTLETVSFDGESELEIINHFAFSNCIKLNRFDFGPKIKTIGIDAFINCPLPMSISFPASLINIQTRAFANSKLTSISFYSDSNLAIGDSAFANCAFVQSILFICKGTISLGFSCFSGLIKLKSIEISRSIIYAGASCFLGCSIDRVSFEQNQISFSSIPSSMFKDCVSLTSFTIPTNCISLEAECLSNTGISRIDIPDNVEILGPQCFKDCFNLETVNIQSSSHLSRIDIGVFEGCSMFSNVSSFDSEHFMSESGAIYSHDKLHMYVYPPASKRIYFSLLEGVENIENGAFLGCINVEVITIPDGNIKSIGDNAFRGCTNLRQITLPSSIKSIGVNAFANCPLLQCGIVIQNSTKPFIDLLKQSELDVKSQHYCSGFSCKRRSIYSIDIPISYIAVFILM
ncbi:surface antigen BspA-like [Trichomonas vaginalis G3]|uniref:Surface antigen BspA-like n=1 Tax=Trichomonas vaginalis (strain ATCC PRA-98 / G3) TaxID=412133 RepID=A2DBR7_TRIV3|nr:antigen BSP-related family [Trichomonas vaginalis G3]EAY22270.1 surface antigen BspA-like [Trichomonas vaginalis G3]KAI5533260.1 antigen BSP-related family [Trichomonas vaginalis G3]|eukprot:XP_001583256.1 surface antigen BspA-like [Trichomonas vaginalis G3]